MSCELIQIKRRLASTDLCVPPYFRHLSPRRVWPSVQKILRAIFLISETECHIARAAFNFAGRQGCLRTLILLPPPRIGIPDEHHQAHHVKGFVHAGRTPYQSGYLSSTHNRGSENVRLQSSTHIPYSSISL